MAASTGTPQCPNDLPQADMPAIGASAGLGVAGVVLLLLWISRRPSAIEADGAGKPPQSKRRGKASAKKKAPVEADDHVGADALAAEAVDSATAKDSSEPKTRKRPPRSSHGRSSAATASALPSAAAPLPEPSANAVTAKKATKAPAKGATPPPAKGSSPAAGSNSAGSAAAGSAAPAGFRTFRCFSMGQPFAALLVGGVKDLETRRAPFLAAAPPDEWLALHVGQKTITVGGSPDVRRWFRCLSRVRSRFFFFVATVF